MPEGDTIFRTARSMSRALIGKPITGFRSNDPLLTRFHDDTPTTGQTVDRVESRGKWLLIHFSGGATLVTHMLMNGSWHLYRRGTKSHLSLGECIGLLTGQSLPIFIQVVCSFHNSARILVRRLESRARHSRLSPFWRERLKICKACWEVWKESMRPSSPVRWDASDVLGCGARWRGWERASWNSRWRSVRVTST